MHIAGRFAGRCIAIAALCGFAFASPAHADQRVSFAAASADAPSADAPNIPGYLSKPSGPGPFPAVVLLHSCLGLPKNRRAIGDRIAGWGYVALFVDDFASRGLKETCKVDFPSGPMDALGALAFLAKLPYVDPQRVAVVGYSQGADTALAIAASPGPGELQFKAAAAFYPPCANRGDAALRMPTLILIGAADVVTPVEDCEQLAKAQPSGNISLVIYPDVSHGFDNPEFGGGKRIFDMWLEYDRAAADQSAAALREFLAERLGR